MTAFRLCSMCPNSKRRVVKQRICVLLLGGWLAGATGVAADPAARVSGQMPTAVSAIIATIQAKPAYAHTTWGIRVSDLASGDILIDQAGGKSLTPGSIMKVYSASTALDAYGVDYRFRTPVYRAGRVVNGVLDGNLVLVASGDFSFGLRDQSDGTLAFNSFPEIDHNYADTGFPGTALVKGGNPLAALDRLAADVHKGGIREVSGDVVIDDRLFEGYDGWNDGRISPIWVNENVIDITTTATRPGARATIEWRPKTAAITVESEVVTVAADPKPITVTTVRPGVIMVRGEIAAGSAPVLNIAQIADPAAFARTVFMEALQRAGVAVKARADGPNPSTLLPAADRYAADDKVAEHVSPPLSEYIKVILKVSYNRGADLMLCLAAVKAGRRDCTAGIGHALDLLSRFGVEKTSTYLFDGAGSDDHGKTSPADQTTFLTRATQAPWGDALRKGMAILGVDGTQAENGVGTPAAGHISIKDGTRVIGGPGDHQALIVAKTQVGYVTTKSKRQLVFGIFLNNAPFASIEDIKAADHDIAAIAAAVQEHY